LGATAKRTNTTNTASNTTTGNTIQTTGLLVS
jgi:hypothetical protein